MPSSDNKNQAISLASESRSVQINNRSHIVVLETMVWKALDEISKIEQRSVDDIISFISNNKMGASLDSSIYVFILSYYREFITEELEVQQEVAEDINFLERKSTHNKEGKTSLTFQAALNAVRESLKVSKN
jgi:predicted DNA-binding ribbon-helix-helix protein